MTKLTVYQGSVPNKKTMGKSTFALSVHGWLAYISVTHTPQMNTVIDEIDAAVLAIGTFAENTQEAASIAIAKAEEVLLNANHAAQSALDSLNAKNAAEAALDAFDDKYLGIKPTDPLLNNDGEPLMEGAFYINSNTGFIRIYNGSSWKQGLSAVAGVESINAQQGAITLKSIGGNSLIGDGDIPINVNSKLYFYGGL